MSETRQVNPSQKVTVAPGATAPPAKPQQAPPSPSPLVKKLEPLVKKKPPKKIIMIGLGLVIAGIASGYLLNVVTGGSLSLKSTEDVAAAGVKVGDVVGSNAKSFKDNVVGVLDRGGLDGEGSHQLLREGGPNQTAYLTSSIVDLELFVGHKVEIWGETFAAQKAGWLMDVGRVKVLELDAPKPFEE